MPMQRSGGLLPAEGTSSDWNPRREAICSSVDVLHAEAEEGRAWFGRCATDTAFAAQRLAMTVNPLVLVTLAPANGCARRVRHFG